MNFSWSAIVLLLIFITPAFLWLSVFRTQFFPKTRTIGPSETTLLLICIVFSVLFNIDLLAEMAHYIASVSPNYVELPSWEHQLIINLFPPLPFVFKFSSLLNFLFNFNIPEHNFLVFIVELHLRTFILALVFTAIMEFILSSIEYYEFLPYRTVKKYEKEQYVKSYFSAKLNLFFDCIASHKFNSEESRYTQEKRSSQWFMNKIKYLRSTFYHPWAIITSTNKLREILIVDILTKEGALYSGKLSTWVPNKSGISAISIEYALKYSPKLEKQETPREKVLIKNHGELVLPSTEIMSYHFWEIRRHFTCNITVKSKYDFEIVKWYILLSFVHNDFFTKIYAQIDLKKDDFIVELSKLNSWLDDNNIELTENLLDFQYDKNIFK